MSQKPTSNGTVTPTRRSRFASGAVERLPLSDGDWVLVRQELTYGQQRRLAAAGLSGVPAALSEQGQGAGLSMDLAAYEIEKLATWVMDWSLKDDDGYHVVVSREAIESLHPDTAEEITAALDAHIEALEAKKAPPTTESGSPATSPSASASAGAGTPS